MTSAEPPIPEPPTEPHPEECCQRGCCPCVYDYHHNAMEKWKAKVIALGHDPDAILAGKGTQAS